MIFQKFLANLFLLNKLKRAENEIGYKLNFKKIPDIWINSLMRFDMTRLWKNFGLKILRGANYFTFGKVKDGLSTRFNFGEPQYQSWLGGYTVKLEQGQEWNLQDHLNLAVADQESWLKRYGDPDPLCKFEEEYSKILGPIKLGNYSGALYEFSCVTHSDAGNGFARIWLKISAVVMAAALNVFSPTLNLQGKSLRPGDKGRNYETLKLSGYIAIFNIEKDVKVVLYGNGVVPNDEVKINTLEIIRNDILAAMNSCEIVKV